jgi:hypothetical protein
MAVVVHNRRPGTARKPASAASRQRSTATSGTPSQMTVNIGKLASRCAATGYSDTSPATTHKTNSISRGPNAGRRACSNSVTEIAPNLVPWRPLPSGVTAFSPGNLRTCGSTPAGPRPTKREVYARHTRQAMLPRVYPVFPTGGYCGKINAGGQGITIWHNS